MYEETPIFRIEGNVQIGKDIPADTKYGNVGDLVLQKLKKKPKFLAQIDAVTGKSYTFEDILQRSVKCAIWLKKQGIRPGDIIGICLPNCLDVGVPILGTLYLAGIVSGWDDAMSTRSAKFFLQLISPKIVFVTAETARNLHQAAIDENVDVTIVTIGKVDGFQSLDDILESVGEVDIDGFVCTPIENPTDVALICWSSGTTGLPKGTEISHRSVQNCIIPEEPTNIAGEVAMWIPTIRWHFGLTLLLESFYSDARAVLSPNFDDDIAYFQYIDKYGITCFVADPCIPLRWAKYKYNEQYQLKSLKKLIVSGAPLSAEKQILMAQAYPHVQILQSYGMTDCGGMSHTQSKDSKPGSSGYICKGQQMKIVDLKTGATLPENQTGEIYLKSPFIMNGYYRNPEATKNAITEDGWLMSKDLGYYDENGEIFVIGRISDFINYRAINLSPAEIEAVLELHPAVMQAAVVPVPHDIEEEHPMAFVTKLPGKQVTVDELMKLVEDNLPWYCKLRAGIKFLDKMPLTSTGKIARKELKAMAKELGAAKATS